jgi:hypothetical protein
MSFTIDMIKYIYVKSTDDLTDIKHQNNQYRFIGRDNDTNTH